MRPRGKGRKLAARVKGAGRWWKSGAWGIGRYDVDSKSDDTDDADSNDADDAADACWKASLGGGVVNFEASCDWKFPAPANTFLKQERLQLAEASCEKLSGYIEIIELPIPNFQTLVVIVVPHITHIFRLHCYIPLGAVTICQKAWANNFRQIVCGQWMTQRVEKQRTNHAS